MKNKQLLLILSALTLFVLCGCAKPKPAAVFYPSAPAAPRIQHLKTFTSQSDFQSDMLNTLLGDTGGYRLGRPMGSAFDNGKLYVADAGKKPPGLAIFDFTLKTLNLITAPLKKPIDIAIDGQSRKYVTDIGMKQIVVFDKDDKFLKTFHIDAENFAPAGISIYNDQLYVSDIKKGTIYVLDINDGSIIREFGNDHENHKMFWPVKASINPVNKQIFIPEAGSALVSVYDLQGTFLNTFGNPGAKAGNFARPKSIAIDESGILYIVDVAFQNVQMFDKDQQILMAFGGSRVGKMGLAMPAGVSLSKKNIPYFQQYADPGFEIEYLIAVTSQGSPGRTGGSYASVDIYGFGKKKGADYSTSQIKEE